MLQFMEQLSLVVSQQVAAAIVTILPQAQQQRGRDEPVNPIKWDIADLGQFDSSISKFEEWWSKMKAYVTLASFKTWHEDALAVWLQMTGPIRGAYARAQINECLAAQQWPMFNELKAELAHTHQGNARTEEFLAKFNALRATPGVSNNYAIWMLEQAMCPEVLQQIYIQGQRKPMWGTFEPEVQNMGAALEAIRLYTSSSSGSHWSLAYNWPSAGVTLGSSTPMGIGAAQSGSRGPARKDFSNYKCHGCGQMGYIRPHCPQNKGKVQQVCSKGIDPHLKAMEGISFKQIVAHIRQLKELELQ
ncbi:hypothetical protein EDC04DRAFT_2598447 [Pisolithus marmoratus]|nr:hypothetical protein EDC04DRAFT_2598447 [Pisolithus marmoratus]